MHGVIKCTIIIVCQTDCSYIHFFKFYRKRRRVSRWLPQALFPLSVKVLRNMLVSLVSCCVIGYVYMLCLLHGHIHVGLSEHR